MGLIPAALDIQKRFESFQRRMAPGSLGGRTDLASPMSPHAVGMALPVTRPGTLSVQRIAAFNNPDGTLVDTNYHEFSQGWASGDTSWFTWPAPGYGGDLSRVALNETGLYTVTGQLFFSAAGGSGYVLETTSGARVAVSPQGISGVDDVSMAGWLVVENLADEHVVRLFTTTANVSSGNLSIVHHGADFETL